MGSALKLQAEDRKGSEEFDDFDVVQ